MLLIVLALVLIGAFFAVVTPLFNTSGAPSADLGGVLPTTAIAGAPLQVAVAFDNTGTSVISPVCIQAAVSGPLQVRTALFQGLDTVSFHNGSACGGALNGQETVSVVVQLVATSGGVAQLTLVPAQGSTELGPGLSGTIRVAAP